LSFLGALARQERPRKRVRAVSKATYAVLRDGDVLPERRAAVLRSIAAVYNRRQVWPTTAEAVAWMVEHGDLVLEGQCITCGGRVARVVEGR